MNPRHRRLLIPGLLAALVVIAVIASIRDAQAAAADSPTEPVSTLTDPRIVEASGLAVSRKFDDLAYVVNDSGNAQQVYAVEISTGRTVGVTTVTGGVWRDPEALTLTADGRLWVADTGDNLNQRTDAALYSLAEPGRRSGFATAQRYGLSYGDIAPNVEALAANPRTGRLHLISKGLTGTVFALPPDLQPGRSYELAASQSIGALVTDATFSADGRYVYLLSMFGRVDRYTVGETWTHDGAAGRVYLTQPETIAAVAGSGDLLVGSEGLNSPLIKMKNPDPKSANADSKADQTKSNAKIKSKAHTKSKEGATADETKPVRTAPGLPALKTVVVGGVAVVLGGLVGMVWLRSRTRA